jgi:hypothetical protein
MIPDGYKTIDLTENQRSANLDMIGSDYPLFLCYKTGRYGQDCPISGIFFFFFFLFFLFFIFFIFFKFLFI